MDTPGCDELLRRVDEATVGILAAMEQLQAAVFALARVAEILDAAKARWNADEARRA